jgi:hypothetical protein
MTPDTTTSTPAHHGAVARALRRWRGLIGLWFNSEYRRGYYKLVAIELRVFLGVRLFAAIGLLAGCVFWLLTRDVVDAGIAYSFLARAFGVIAILLAAPIYAAEQRQGTFELVWLATGSKQAMLRMKVVTLLLANFLLMLPCVIILNRFLGGTLPFGPTMFCLMSNAYLIIGVMAWLGTYLTQAWAGGLVGAALLAPGVLLLENWNAKLNLFANPFMKENLPTGRAVSIVLAAVLIHFAAKRLQEVIKG